MYIHVVILFEIKIRKKTLKNPQKKTKQNYSFLLLSYSGQLAIQIRDLIYNF